ncbi:hypothetical protein Ae201684P_007144 [Aphanomyces euteiches]|uniref:Uncharacterized protein n=1 Tax=Aphanomyces euteiches TaxID=100861 RepID=A0A6G0X8E6_9STRA|nr:hypothetical protein Ae201684_007346 [Aphanomyces euteiches]KAH9100953.1 hypothetical protein Ae201684P_007144 [Aphanomyces euteiches]
MACLQLRYSGFAPYLPLQSYATQRTSRRHGRVDRILRLYWILNHEYFFVILMIPRQNTSGRTRRFRLLQSLASATSLLRSPSIECITSIILDEKNEEVILNARATRAANPVDTSELF